ncbi:hypothetical protein Tco_1341118 [Tanacetum coccineum]
MKYVKKSIDESAQLKREYDRRVNKRLMQTQESKVDSSKALDVTKCSETKSDKHDTSSSSRNYLTHVVDADIRPHTEQSEPIFDTYLLEKIDSNTTPDSTNMSHMGGEIDQDTEHYQVKSPLLNAEFFKIKDMAEKEVYNELSNRFLQLEKHCISLEFQYNKRKKVFKVTNHFAKPSILGKPVLQPLRNQSVVRQPTAFRSERPKFSKPQFAYQVDVNNVLSKPVTPHYLPKVREFVFVKPNYVIASGSSRNSSKESYGSNDMAHNYYLEEGYRFSLNKSFAVHEKPNTPRSCLRWKPMGRIFKTAGLRWIPTGKMFTDCTTKFDSKTPNGSNEDTTNPYECDQTLNVSAGTLNLSAAGSPSSTTIDQDVPSASTSPTNQEIQSQVTHQGVEELIHGHQNAKFDKASLLHNLSSDPSFEETSL